MKGAAFERVAARVAINANGKALCPAHPDRNPSLSVKRTDVGVALHCHAGCSTEAIVTAIGLTMVDLFDEPLRQSEPPGKTFYPYTDADGQALYLKVRYQAPNGKRFAVLHADGKTKGMPPDAPHVLYRWPEVNKAVANEQPVYVVEGEKDVDALTAEGLTATTGDGGADNWGNVAALATKVLAGARVVIIPDRDQPGERYAQEVAATLLPVAASVTLMRTRDGFKDAAEHLGAGYTVADFTVVASTDAVTYPKAQALSAWLDEEASAQPTEPSRQAVVVQMSTVIPQAIRWLWFGRLPIGKLVMFDGDPDVGKSTLSLDLAARISNGALMPGELYEERRETGARSVVLLSAEDGLADTIRPRLDAAKANVDLIHAITAVRIPGEDGTLRTVLPSLPRDIDLLEQTIKATGAGLVVIDVFMAYLSTKTNSKDDQEVRAVLAELAEMAERCQCCILMLRHFRKAGGSSIHAGGGSIGIIGAARVGLVAGFDPDDRELEDADRRRVLAVGKCNLAAKQTALSYRIIGVGDSSCIEWLGTVTHTADSLVSQTTPTTKRGEKEAFLRELLGDGPMRVDMVDEAARERGWTLRQMRTPLKEIGGRITKSPEFGGPWVWHL